MKRAWQWIGIGLGSLVGLIGLMAMVLSLIGSGKLNKQYDVVGQSLTIPEDSAALERGQYVYTTHCSGCHGADLGGTPFFADPALGNIPAPNLTMGQGGIGSRYSSADFVRAIRHGVDADGRPLAIMPSGAFQYFSDEDLAAVIAYIRSSSSVDKDQGERDVKFVGRILMAVGALDFLAAESIDHDLSTVSAPEQGVTIAYGEYLVNTSDCRNCHGETLAGAQPPEPGAPLAPDLTADGTLASWSAADFSSAMRTGRTPDNRQIDAAYMPWEEFGHMTDDDLAAVFLYLQSLTGPDSAN